MIGAERFRYRNKIGRFTGVDQSEVLSIVGMPATCEAEWLKARDMPWRMKSDEQVSIVEVVNLALSYKLSLEGWMPRESRFVVGEAIPAVFYNAFIYADQSLEVRGIPEDIERFKQQFSVSPDLANELTGGPHWYTHLCECDDGNGFRLARATEPISDVAKYNALKYISLRDLACYLVTELKRPLLLVELVRAVPAIDRQAKWLSIAPNGFKANML